MPYYNNCKINNIKKGTDLVRLSFDIEDTAGVVLNTIQISNVDAVKQIRDLLDMNRNYLFLAYGMTDIDIWQKEPGLYLISWSPCDGCDVLYEVDDNEIRKLAQTGAEGKST